MPTEAATAATGAAVASTPESATNASSGDAAALAGQAQTTSRNTQVGVAVAAGGSGNVSATNLHTTTVSDASAASSQSGLSVALAPTVQPGTPVPTGVTVANSGGATANALQAQNTVDNTATGVVQVGGANQSNVSLTQASSVKVQDTAASAASSGQAWAVANGAAGSPSGVATPATTANAAPTSAPSSSTGLVATNNLSNEQSATMTLPGGSPTTATGQAINVVGNQVANVTAGGAGTAASGAAASPAGGGTPGTTVVTSGAANAQGLTAQNTVNTNANVNVRVAGQNFAPITVIINSIAQIFNVGQASATSGDVTAGGSSGAAQAAAQPATGGAGQHAASGSAQATGAQVQNTVNLRQSASVKVNGNNYNPINILLNLVANLTNVGMAGAHSGDAQATGAGGGTAASGGASATGLQVMNLVSMWADAAVDIEGNNYAPIFIKIVFDTTIRNTGLAEASTGNVSAGKASPSKTASTTVVHSQPDAGNGSGSGGASSSGIVGTAVHAESGTSLAVSNQLNTGINSTQVASANSSSDNITPQLISRMLQNMPSGSWDRIFDQNAQAATTPTVEPGLSSRSGNSTAAGLVTDVNVDNTQVSVCKDPGQVCSAANGLGVSISANDLPTNPAQKNTPNPPCSGVCSTVHDALANATPTPVPSSNANSNASSNDNSHPNDSGTTHTANGHHSMEFVATTRIGAHLAANGHLVLVDLWDQWPGRRLPPMPNPSDHAPTTSTVSAGNAWPDSDELPLPDLGAPAPPAGQRQAVATRRAVSRSQDMALADGDAFPVLNLVDVDPWGAMPGLEALPVPPQRAVAHPLAAASDQDQTPVEPTDAGASPIDFGPAVLLSMVFGGLIGSRRGRLLLSSLGAPVARLVGRARLAISSRRFWLGRQTARGLAILRLTLGIFGLR